jgi:threonine dehydrogenase-like Zn-dependent dehydrogenase
MKEIVLEKPGRFVAQETRAPESPRAGEAIVRVRRIGVCGTDLHAFRGKQPFFTYPRRLGHELGVEIAEVANNARGLRAGDRCAVEPYLTCGNCIACRNGKTNCCIELKCLGVHTDGGACEYITVPIDKLYPSNTLSFEQLAIIEPLAIGAHGVNRANLQRGELALVIGAGPIGLSAIQFAIAAGAKVAVADVNRERLEACQRHLGSQDSMQRAFQYVSHGGRLIFVGLGQFDITFHDPAFHRKELTLMSSRNSTSVEFNEILRMMEGGEIDIMPWITHRCPFEDMISEFPSWLDPTNRVIKAVVEIN